MSVKSGWRVFFTGVWMGDGDWRNNLDMPGSIKAWLVASVRYIACFYYQSHGDNDFQRLKL